MCTRLVLFTRFWGDKPVMQCCAGIPAPSISWNNWVTKLTVSTGSNSYRNITTRRRLRLPQLLLLLPSESERLFDTKIWIMWSRDPLRKMSTFYPIAAQKHWSFVFHFSWRNPLSLRLGLRVCQIGIYEYTEKSKRNNSHIFMLKLIKHTRIK